MTIAATRNPQGTCLIVGGGYAGARLARCLLEQRLVLALVRSAASAEDLVREGIPAVRVDLDEPAGLRSFPVPATLKAVVYLVPPSGRGTEDLRLAAFLAAMGDRRPGVLLYISTTGVYGDARGAEVDEASPVAPRGDASRQRLDAEGRVARWCLARETRCVIFRVPAIYGPGRLPLDRLRRGEPVLRAQDSGPGNRIHVDDLVGACLAALAQPVAGVFNLTDGQPESMAAFSLRVAALAGLPAPPQVAWAEAERLLSPGLLSFLRESRCVLSRRSGELGWTPRYADPSEGIRASLREMGLLES